MAKTYFVVGSAKSHDIEEQPYGDLKQALNAVELVETNFENCDYLIFVNHNKKYLKKYLNLKRDPAKLILIRLEPPAVLPVQYSKKVEKNYNLILDPGAALKSTSTAEFIPWPYRISKDPANPDVDSADVAASFQEAVVDVLARKAERAATQIGARGLVLGGGVAANGPLRERFNQIADSLDVKCSLPSREMCTDNAAMIGAAAWYRLRSDGPMSFDTGAFPNLALPVTQ